ncbi:hypothetical protein [Streptomyces sp. UH6]|uniref:hypothetical protein n=1 Tax=Streptomyces sp. UH6 TaxID=2748379 RepID=UPI0015D4F526|nr:hypothetical protein [Streptomyces sp. UH6]NYV73038.1 hypothetical protein [Streptomyces sp. UH6]
MNADLSSIPTPALIALGVILVLHLALALLCLALLVRTPADRLVFGRKWPWVLIVVGVNLIGSILFLALARRPAAVEEQLPDPGPAGAERVVRSLYGEDRG